MWPERKVFVAARAKARAQRVVRAVPRYSALGEEKTSPALVAESVSPLSTSQKFRRLCLRRSPKPRRLNRNLISTPPSEKKTPQLFIGPQDHDSRARVRKSKQGRVV